MAIDPALASRHDVTIMAWEATAPTAPMIHHHRTPKARRAAEQTTSIAATSQANAAAVPIGCFSAETSIQPNPFAAPMR